MAIESPARARFVVVDQIADPYLHLFSAHPVAPKETPVCKIMRIAPGKLGKTCFTRIVLDDSVQPRLIINAIARGWNARAIQHAQREAHPQCIVHIGQGGDIHRLEIWSLN